MHSREPSRRDAVSRRSVPGTGLTVSSLSIEIPPAAAGPPALEERRVAGLRRAREAGVTTFVLPAAPLAAHAERTFAAAFPHPDTDLVMLLRPTADSGDDNLGGTTAPASATRFEQLHAALRDARGGRDVAGGVLVLWEDGPTSSGTSDTGIGRGLDQLQEEGLVDGWARRIDPRAPIRAAEWAEPTPRLFWGPMSILETDLATELGERAARAPSGFFAIDPLAAGRLDGTRFARSVTERRPDVGPVNIRDLRKEFDPVLRLGFLTADRRRTLAQAAVRYVLAQPAVCSVVLPLPDPERLNELLGTESSPPLTPSELERLSHMEGGQGRDRPRR
jgi:aryl-alcohol dehydrogenase-like predicted oxidoreductase